jgi:transposase IS66-like protein
MYSLIVTAKMNDIGPQTWLGFVLDRLSGPAVVLTECLPCYQSD